MGIHVRFGFSGVGFGMRGEPRFRVRGARIIRCDRGSVPFPSVREVKSLEDAPRMALGSVGFPLPGRRASGVGAIEPIVFFFRIVNRKVCGTKGRACFKIGNT